MRSRAATLFEKRFKPGGRISVEGDFQPGRNCDGVGHADRFSLLIDGSDYFRVLRARLRKVLTHTDAYDRYCPRLSSVPALETGCVNVHSKRMVDDDLLLAGSANLNNCSMVLGTECNLTIDANDDPRLRAALVSMRNTLLWSARTKANGRASERRCRCVSGWLMSMSKR